MSCYGFPQPHRRSRWPAWLLIGAFLSCLATTPVSAQSGWPGPPTLRTVSAAAIRRLAPIDSETSPTGQAARPLGDVPTIPTDNRPSSVLTRAAVPTGSLSARTKTQQAVFFSSPDEPTNRVHTVGGEEPDLSEPLPDIKPTGQIDLIVTRDDRTTPPDYAGPWLKQQGIVPHTTGTSRDWPTVDYRWAAPAVAHHPLYFEDVNLERYGYVYGCLQPAVSCAHFFGNVALLPYHVVQDPPCECVYSLGYARPGSCVPRYHPRWLPGDLHAAGGEAAAIAGLILLIP